MLHPLQDQADIISGYIMYYCWFGYFLLMAWMLHMRASNNMKLLKSISTSIQDHIEFVISAVFVGYLFVISEFIATTVYLGDLFMHTFHLYLWFPSLICFAFVFFKVMHVCCKKHKEKSDGLNLIVVIFTLGILIFLIHIYCYALPTFLLLLVYPTKIITVVAYLITFVFVTSITSSISIHLIIVYAINFHTVGRCTGIMMIINAIFVFFYIPYLCLHL